MLKIAFLFDKLNDWLVPHIPASLRERKDAVICTFYEHEKVREFDIVFVLGYTKLIFGDFLTDNGLTLLVHESDLPQGKGFSPVQWQILEGKARIRVSLIELQQQVDSGDILEQTDLVLDGTELYEEIRAAQADVTFSLIEKFLDAYPNLNRKKQHGKSTFYRRRTEKDSELDVNLTIKQLFPLLRIGNNEGWPSYFNLGGVTYILKIYKKD